MQKFLKTVFIKVTTGSRLLALMHSVNFGNQRDFHLIRGAEVSLVDSKIFPTFYLCKQILVCLWTI